MDILFYSSFYEICAVESGSGIANSLNALDHPLSAILVLSLTTRSDDDGVADQAIPSVRSAESTEPPKIPQ